MDTRGIKEEIDRERKRDNGTGRREGDCYIEITARGIVVNRGK